MINIRVFSHDLQLLAEIDDYEFLSFTEDYHGVGSFELKINNQKLHVKSLQKRNLIMLDNNPDKVGIIQHREIGIDDSGKQSEQWTIKGSTLDAVTYQRLILPPLGVSHDVATGSAETVMKQYISNHLVNPVDAKRKIPLLSIAPDSQRGEQLTYNSRFKNLGEELTTISTISNVGWKIGIDIDTRSLMFDCYMGTDRTTLQADNPPIIFSTDFETLKEGHFLDSDIGVKNVGYVAGQGEGVEREVVEIGEAEGLERFELFTDARDVENTDELYIRGETNLQEFNGEISFEAQIMSNGVYVYGKDWFLGDLVTVKHSDWGVEMHPRITSVTEIYEPNGYTATATFGKAIPTLISKIKQEIKQVSVDVHK